MQIDISLCLEIVTHLQSHGGTVLKGPAQQEHWPEKQSHNMESGPRYRISYTFF